VYEAMKQLPRESLQFLAFRAADPIIQRTAAEVLDWLENREALWTGAGSSPLVKSVFDATRDETTALLQAAELARTNGQIVAWDTSSR
jgi:hypothetical protein